MRKQTSKGKVNQRRNGAVTCAWMAMITGLASFLPYIIITGGFFTLAEDYNQQQIPFLTAAVEGIKMLPQGEWLWNLDLGASLVTGFGYYNLGSPFTWLALPFSREIMPYLLVWLILLKYVTAAVTAYLWLKRFVREDTGAILGGLLYAFSGFQSTNLLFHFHDVTAFFPLLLLGLDRLTEERKGLFFSVSVLLNCLVNYVFFVQEVVFAVIYFLFRNLKKGRFAETLKMGGIVLAFAAVGVAMAAPVFLPNVIYLLNSPRGERQFDWSQLLYSTEGNLFILKGFLFPGEAMREQSSVFARHFLSTSAYVPLFGMSFVIIYLAENRGWLKRLIIALILVSFSPLLQAGFMLFTETFQRWWYMLNLLFVLATVQVYDRNQYQTPKGLWILGIYAGAVTAFCAVLWKAPWVQGGTLVIRRELYFLFAGTALISSVLCFGLTAARWLSRRTVMVLVMAACIVTTGMVIGVYRKAMWFDYIKEYYKIGASLETIDEQYRYREVNNLYTVPGHGAGVGSFSSTKENSSYEFQRVFDLESAFDAETMEVPGLPELLGGKYKITAKTADELLTDAVVFEGEDWLITAGDACPIGFATGNYITCEELRKYEADQRAYVLMDAVVVKTPEKVSDFHGLRWGEKALSESPEVLIQRAEENSVHEFKRDSGGFSCTTDFGQDQLVFFSVPNDTGWSAAIDYEEAEIIDSCGMMVLSVPKGKHRIVFSYHTPGFRTGMILSAAGWAVFLLMGLYARRRAARKQV